VTAVNIFDRAERVVTERTYAVDDVRRAVEHPRRAVSELNKLYNHFRAGQRYNPTGIDIFAEDWDNLLILDACRYDAFERHSTLPGRTESRISRGSTSPEFIRGSFTGKTLHDVVYVSANDWYAKLKDDIDAEVHALEFVDRDAMDGLTSHPETVAAAARDAAETYPDKRLIVHFLQPHQPYLGPAGDQFVFSKHMIDSIRDSGASREDVMRAYRENLDLVLEAVEPLLSDLTGKSVVTADHGELLNDRERPIPVRRYGHPEGVYVENLVKVPWHIHESGSRKEIIAEQPAKGASEFNVENIEQNLRDLGYRT
jgi:hypothetical protein